MNAKLGQILVDGNGRTLYLFEADKGSSSTCYGACAAYWPPLLTGGAPMAGTGVNGSLLGTTKRTDGTTEVTYGAHPLYYVVTDHNPGDATGQAVNNFGGFWYVVATNGNKIA
jgi:predicted lipoprotein with Yx(FWY)xxD motif